ncbi:lecithin:cholesterol acyltransferase, partial [Enterobacter sp. BIGb0383]|uniref:esterase/lipase family protein n=1 Tax=unclassified Enterobacter TaxID=2608935 RepID=UPI000F49E282
LMDSVMETEMGDVTLSKEEIDLSYRYIYPVFAVGYNWLQSNADSAKDLGNKIDETIRFYREKGRKCEKVILITHSMGSLVARHYTQNMDGEKNVLGVVHGVMPSLGAAATYRRMKAGTENPQGDVKGWLASQVLGADSWAMTAVLSQSPGPLQLLPGREYGSHWLKIIDGKYTYSYPDNNPYEDIYLQRDKWWGLCDDSLINPGKSYTQQALNNDWLSFSAIIERKVMRFIEDLAGKYHHNTYAFYSADKAFASYGDICWQAKTPPVDEWINRHRSRDASQGRIVDKSERQDIRTIASPLSGAGWAKGIKQTYQILPAEEGGDGTVPVRSGRIPESRLKARYQVSVGHEPAYQSPLAQEFTLRALVKTTQKIKSS